MSILSFHNYQFRCFVLEIRYRTIFGNHTILDMGRAEEELGFIEQLSEASEQT